MGAYESPPDPPSRGLVALALTVGLVFLILLALRLSGMLD